MSPRVRGTHRHPPHRPSLLTTGPPETHRLFRYYVLRSNVARSNVAGVSDDGSLRRPNDPPVLILTSLADGPKHGHALAKDIEQFAGVTLGPGALYGAITRLEERGLIEALPSDDRRRPYRITAAGSAALMAAVADMRRLADVGAKRLARSATRRRRLA